jgi:predicted hydrocarbon binding protein
MFPQAVLEDFGRFVAPDLLKMHAHSVQPQWRTLDLVEHTEAAIHQVVRQTHADAQPPRIACTRKTECDLVVEYSSPRKLCAFAKGIVGGIAAHYGEQVAITESSCMLKGDDRCILELHVERRKRRGSATSI